MLKYAVGQSVPRTEDPRLLKGRGQYVDDFNMPFQVHAVMVRSTHAHATIKSINSTAALAAPGVMTVLTGSDCEADGLGFVAGPNVHKRRDGSDMYRPPRPAITSDRVRHVGQIIAMVIADTVNAAKDAADLVDVEYETLPINVVGVKARESDAIWPSCTDNESFYYQAGNAEAAEAGLAKSANVFKQKFIISRIHANTMEPRGALGFFDPGENIYTIHAGIQRPYAIRANLARNFFKVPENKVRIITGDMGGSFGMKGALYPEIPLVAWASKRVGRPVKWRCDRSEGLMADDHARDNVTEAELGFDADGRMTALRVKTTANLGAYMAFRGMGPPTGNIGTLAGPYNMPAAHVAVSGVFTNTSPLSAYRGAGRPEAAYVIERMMDIAARGMGIDPAELRRRNFIPPEAMPYKTALTFTYDCGEFAALFDMALDHSDYKGLADRKAKSKADGKLRGVGLSTTIEVASAPQTGETVEVRFNASGTVTILAGSTNHGQGHETVYKQILCGQLGIEPEDIRVLEGDTERLSFGTGTGGSRSATLGGSAVLMAADKVIKKAKQLAAHMMETAAEDIAFEDGNFTVAGTDKSMNLKDVARAAFDPTKLPKGMEPGLYEIATFVPEKANFPNGCHVVEVEITPETGEMKIDRYTAVDDCGVELNPLLVKGQVHGGIVQGAGQAFLEYMVYDEDSGQLLTGSFMDYCMPRADNFCNFEIEDRPVPTKTNPIGSKGVGESGTVGALAAVMNAINDALHPLGITHLEMPTTAERIWKAIEVSKAA
jgi:carbon-monoxide dehydrogenase large subunit